MVFNSMIVLSVAHLSADAWQRISCIQLQDRISSHQLIDLICCFPLQQLGHLALYLCTFLCLPPPDTFYSYSYYPTSDDDYDHDHHHHHGSQDGTVSSSSPSIDADYFYYHSHSD